MLGTAFFLVSFLLIILKAFFATSPISMITFETRKNAVPSISTYKLRSSEIFYKGIRIIPSYIMTGQSIQI